MQYMKFSVSSILCHIHSLFFSLSFKLKCFSKASISLLRQQDETSLQWCKRHAEMNRTATPQAAHVHTRFCRKRLLILLRYAKRADVALGLDDLIPTATLSGMFSGALGAAVDEGRKIL